MRIIWHFVRNENKYYGVRVGVIFAGWKKDQKKRPTMTVFDLYMRTSTLHTSSHIPTTFDVPTFGLVRTTRRVDVYLN